MQRFGDAAQKRLPSADQSLINYESPQEIKERMHRKEGLQGGPVQIPSWLAGASGTTTTRLTRPEQASKAPKRAKFH